MPAERAAGSHADEQSWDDPNRPGQPAVTSPRSRTDLNGSGCPHMDLRIRRLGVRVPPSALARAGTPWASRNVAHRCRRSCSRNQSRPAFRRSSSQRRFTLRGSIGVPMAEANTSPCSRQASPAPGARRLAVSCAPGDGAPRTGAAPRSPGAGCLQLDGLKPDVNALHGLANVKLPRREVDVIPPEGEQLATAKTGRQRQHIQSFQPLTVDYIEQALRLHQTKARPAVVIERARCCAPGTPPATSGPAR